jgi:MSHA biogenesis protein MshO
MRRLAGFTLIELIMVIVLLAIVATVSVQFVGWSTRGALDAGARQQRSLAGVVISEQISRQLREALPTSVRINKPGSCIEWMPIHAASHYLNLSVGSPVSGFDAAPLPGGQPASGRAVVYGYGSDVYNLANPGPVSPPATLSVPTGPDSVAEVKFTGGATHRFPAQSPERRFYLVGAPVSVCQVGRFLYRYENYGINTSPASGLPVTYPGREVIAASLVPNSLKFDIVPPSYQRGAVVSFAFTLEDPESGETTAIHQEVQVRNVP